VNWHTSAPANTYDCRQLH